MTFLQFITHTSIGGTLDDAVISIGVEIDHVVSVEKTGEELESVGVEGDRVFLGGRVHLICNILWYDDGVIIEEIVLIEINSDHLPCLIIFLASRDPPLCLALSGRSGCRLAQMPGCKLEARLAIFLTSSSNLRARSAREPV